MKRRPEGDEESEEEDDDIEDKDLEENDEDEETIIAKRRAQREALVQVRGRGVKMNRSTSRARKAECSNAHPVIHVYTRRICVADTRTS